MAAFIVDSNSAGEWTFMISSRCPSKSPRQFGSRPLRRIHLRSSRPMLLSMTLRIVSGPKLCSSGVMGKPLVLLSDFGNPRLHQLANERGWQASAWGESNRAAAGFVSSQIFPERLNRVATHRMKGTVGRGGLEAGDEFAIQAKRRHAVGDALFCVWCCSMNGSTYLLQRNAFLRRYAGQILTDCPRPLSHQHPRRISAAASSTETTACCPLGRRRRTMVTYADNLERRGSRACIGSELLDHRCLGSCQSAGDILASREVFVETSHHGRRRRIAHGPQGGDHRSRAGEQERSRDIEHTLLTKRRPHRRVTG